MHRALLPLVLATLGSQLAGCYLAHTARGQLDLMARREPISKVIASPATPVPVKTQLERVVAIRNFAVDELGLPDNGSYRSYADLGRPYVVWNVFAAPEFSVEPRHWCFPIAGCVAYRGYFNETKARAFAARLKDEGYDVYVGGVAAYSTLGHFDDPVLNTMIGWNDVQLAAILFHELSHQLLYVPGDSPFNEGFASVVEDEGVRRWLATQGRAAELTVFHRQASRYLEFVALVRATRARLATLYASGAPPQDMKARKQTVLDELAQAHARLRAEWGGRSSFDRWFSEGVNNAHLVSLATYQDCVPGIEAVLAATGGDLPEFYRRMWEIARLEPAARAARVCAHKAPSPDELLTRGARASRYGGAVRIASPGHGSFPEIFTHDSAHRVRLDAERGETIHAAHAVDGE
jgi:predicted aminopeptidase